MDWGLLVNLDALPQVVAVAGMILLALALLYLDFTNAGNRAFALFLIVRALAMGAATLREVFRYSGDAANTAAALYWADVFPYFVIAAPAALVYFVSVYPRRVGWIGTSRLGVTLLVASTGFVEFLYLARHELWSTTVVAGPGDPRGLIYESATGPLFPILGFMYFGYALVALVFALEFTKLPAGSRRQSVFFVLAAFLLNALFDEAGVVLQAARGLLVLTPATWIIVSGLVLAAVAAVHLLRHAARPATDPFVRQQVYVLSALLPLPALSALAPTFMGHEFNLLITGLWRLSLPVLVSYALVRHALFGIDLTVKLTIRRGTVAVIFLGAFFVGAQLAQNYFTNRYDWAYGGVAAGVLLFVASPLQRWAERFAEAAMPGVKPVAELSHPERVALFREQAAIAWEDGVLNRKERLLLNSLRERLGLSHAEASEVEHGIMLALEPAVGRKRAAPA